MSLTWTIEDIPNQTYNIMYVSGQKVNLETSSCQNMDTITVTHN